MYKTHVFICTNGADKEGKCGHKGAEHLRSEVKAACAMKNDKTLRVNASGCLGKCESGIAAVIYPQGKWLTELKSTDKEIVLNAIAETHK